MTALPPNPQTGPGKAYAATAAGFAQHDLIYAVNQVLAHFGTGPLPAEICAAAQGLVTLAAVYYAPHGN